MSAKEQIPTAEATSGESGVNAVTEDRSQKILNAKDLYSFGSRNYLVKNYADAADSLSRVCEIYEEIHGELSDELGMPYLLYAKSLIALAVEENKVIDVPDEEAEDDDEEDDEENPEEETGNAETDNTASTLNTNGEALATGSPSKKKTNDAAEAASSTTKINGNTTERENAIKATDEADSTEDAKVDSDANINGKSVEDTAAVDKAVSLEDEQSVSSTADGVSELKNVQANGVVGTKIAPKSKAEGGGIVEDGEKPSTSNGETVDGEEVEGDDNEAGSTLQLAWEILELAAKIFKRQGHNGLANLAEVHTELGNIEFENNVLGAAREDYEKALKIYGELPVNYRRASAEIHYKIGLTYLMDGLNQEGAASLKEACHLLDCEVKDLKAKEEPTETVKNTIQDIIETKQEIWDKIAEIEEMEAQQYADVRAALDSYIKPMSSGASVDGAGPSTSSAAASSVGSSSSISSSKPNDITHLIKRKKPEDTNSEAEAVASPAKRPAV